MVNSRDEILIRNSKSKTIKNTIIPILVFIASSYFFGILTEPSSNIIFLRIISLLFGLISLLLIIYMIKKAILYEPELTLNKNGLFIRSGSINNISIPWNLIDRTDIYFPPKGSNLVLLFVKEPDIYLGKAKFIERIFIKSNLSFYKTPIYINPVFLELNEFEICKVINRYLKKYKKTTLPNTPL